MMAAQRISSAPTLHRLLDGLAEPLPGQDPAISGMTENSQAVEPGFLFCARAGERHHGLDFARAALEAGAVAILWEPPLAGRAAALRRCREAGVPCIEIPGLGAKLGLLADRFYDEPSAHLQVVGVTGTDGKTSVTQFLAQALAEPTAPCAVMGTLGYGLYGSLRAGGHTTPGAIDVHRVLAEAAAGGARFASMEVSSHALDQARVAGVRFAVAVLTNLGRDHLDYHGTLDAYRAAKARLFEFPGLGAAVLNMDDELGRRLLGQRGPHKAWSYSAAGEPGADFRCQKIEHQSEGLAVDYAGPDGDEHLDLPLLGDFNVANVLAVRAVLHALGFGPEAAGERLASLRPVAGRMERFAAEGRPLIVVDYAHTPGALEAALRACRDHVAGRLWCVFGCGGDRDRGKRPLMAEAAEQWADAVVLTDDNPRGEEPERIVAEIRSGFSHMTPHVERDREAAIRLAVRGASPGDAVLVAGKGHEDYQLIGGRRLHLSDREIAERVLAEGSS